MKVWRICSARYPVPDGQGARLSGGRWNLPGTAIVYTSATISLAALEILVHTDSDILPVNQIIRSAEIPDDLAIQIIEEAQLPHDWKDFPAPKALQALGSAWAGKGETAILSVPSVVINQERNYLLNPAHQDFTRIVWSPPNAFELDPRLLR